MDLERFNTIREANGYPPVDELPEAEGVTDGQAWDND
jgi:hypothetical protein